MWSCPGCAIAVITTRTPGAENAITGTASTGTASDIDTEIIVIRGGRCIRGGASAPSSPAPVSPLQRMLLRVNSRGLKRRSLLLPPKA